MNFILYAGYISYLVIGIFWALYVHDLIEDDPKYKDHHALGITMVVNFLIWPICILALAYARIFLKRDTLFVDKEDD